VDPPSVKLSHLTKALGLVYQDSIMGVFDLRSCYFHVRLHPSQTTYFGVKALVQGKEIYMTFDYLPFGLNSAVHCVTKLWKPILAYLQLHDIPISIYIDDGFFLAPNREAWNQHQNLIFDVISKAGWTIAQEKSDAYNTGSHVKTYLGFITDSQAMKVFLTPEKLSKITVLIEALVAQKVKAKELAKVMWLHAFHHMVHYLGFVLDRDTPIWLSLILLVGMHPLCYLRAP